MSEGQAKATRRPRPSSYSVMNADATPARRLSSHRTKRAAAGEAEWLRARGYNATVEPFFPTEAPALPSALNESWREQSLATCARRINARLFRARSARGMQLVMTSREEWAREGWATYLELSRAVERARRSAAYAMEDYFREAEGWKGRATL